MSEPKVWLVTGAGRGLGRAIALAAVESGDVVVATVRGDHDLPDHERIDVRTLDVTDRRRAHEVVAETLAAHGRLDVVVNNAGYGLVGAIEEVDEDAARAVLETHALGAMWTTQAALPAMRRQGAGHVVQISSTGGVGAMAFLGLYNAAKWALEGWSEALAGEVAGFGVRVTIVEPGGLDTAWATGGMRFAAPLPDYDDARAAALGSAEVPWPAEGTGGGTDPAEAAEAIVAFVRAPDDRLRLLVGDDAPGQVAAVLAARDADWARDARYRGI